MHNLQQTLNTTLRALQENHHDLAARRLADPDLLTRDDPTIDISPDAVHAFTALARTALLSPGFQLSIDPSSRVNLRWTLDSYSAAPTVRNASG